MTLTEWRQSKGWTQWQAADRAGMSRISWCRWETGTRGPSLKTAKRLVDFTCGEVTFEELITTRKHNADAKLGAGLNMGNRAIECIHVQPSWVRVRAPAFADLLQVSDAEAIGYAVKLWIWACDFADVDGGEDAVERAALKRGTLIVKAVGWTGEAARFLDAASSDEARLLEVMPDGVYRIRGLRRVAEAADT